jgi:hypothetical protein
VSFLLKRENSPLVTLFDLGNRTEKPKEAKRPRQRKPERPRRAVVVKGENRETANTDE